MRLLFVVDARSPIAINWIAYFSKAGHEVHLVSTFPADPPIPLASFSVVPVAFSAMKGTGTGAKETQATIPGRRNLNWQKWMSGTGVTLRTHLRQVLGPFTLPGAATQLREVIEHLQPDLVHAMRIPYEGMLAGLALEAGGGPPLLLSIWGNDFTLHARSTPLMARYTRLALTKAKAIHADCHRDIRLSLAWGFDPNKPNIVLPGSGGVQPSLFYPAKGVPEDPPVVLNPRGLRAYVRNDLFFQAAALVLKRFPQVRFVCTGMAGRAEAESKVKTLGIADRIDLLPVISREAMAELFRQSQVLVSPSTHDGTPNTLLEGMACGCFPVAGDLESLREWITPGVNGLLVELSSAQKLADAICLALERSELRRQAAKHNLALVRQHADYHQVMQQAERFYRVVIAKR